MTRSGPIRGVAADDLAAEASVDVILATLDERAINDAFNLEETLSVVTSTVTT